MINKYAEIRDRLALYNACKGVLRVKMATGNPINKMKSKVYKLYVNDNGYKDRAVNAVADKYLAWGDDARQQLVDKAKRSLDVGYKKGPYADDWYRKHHWTWPEENPVTAVATAADSLDPYGYVDRPKNLSAGALANNSDKRSKEYNDTLKQKKWDSWMLPSIKKKVRRI